MRKEIEFKKDTIKIRPVKCNEGIKAAVNELLFSFENKLPEDKGASILIKPNLNNDLNALMGNSSDLRVIAAVVEALLKRGFSNITIADGANVGIDRRGINVFRRLRVDRLAKYFGVKLANLNSGAHTSQPFPTGEIGVSDLCLNVDFLISIPKPKTHSEAMMSLAVKNLMGCVRGQEKRKMHADLPANLVRINEIIKPGLYIIDGLVVMEGNGPGDGFPRFVGQIAAGADPFLIDLAFAKLIGYDWQDVDYLKVAYEKGHITSEDLSVTEYLEVSNDLRKPPELTRLAKLTKSGIFKLPKLLLRPIFDRRPVAEMAYRLKILQDIYCLDDDSVSRILYDEKLCKDGCKKCRCFCPTGFEKVKSGAKDHFVDGKKADLSGSPDCIGCLYCFLVCPEKAISLEGDLGFLKFHIEKYHKRIMEYASAINSD